MLGRECDSDDAPRLPGYAASPTVMILERGEKAAGIASRLARAVAAGALIAGALALAAPSPASARELRLRYDVTVPSASPANMRAPYRARLSASLVRGDRSVRRS